MSSSMFIGRSVGAAAATRSSPVTHTKATASVFRAAFASVTNNGDAAPATGSEEDKEGSATGDDDPVSRVAEKAADVGRNVKDAAAEVKDAGRVVKDRAKEVGQDIKEAVKETR